MTPIVNTCVNILRVKFFYSTLTKTFLYAVTNQYVYLNTCTFMSTDEIS